MIRHFFKLTWNKKRKHLALVIELFFAYLVTSFLILFLFETASYHFAKPGFNINNLISVWATKSSSDTTRLNLQAIKEVKSISLSELVPYYNLTTDDTLAYGNNTMRVYRWGVDEQFYSTMGLSMKSGRWFTPADRKSVKKPVIITEALSKQLNLSTASEGRVLKVNSKEYTLRGVVNDLNDPSGNYKNRTHLFLLDTGYVFLVKLSKPLDNQIYRKLKTSVTGLQNEFNDNVTPISHYKEKYASKYDSLTIIMSFLAGFLIINVLLGLFSLLYQNINRRKPEIGVRRAAGAGARQIYSQIVWEVVLLATIAMIPGIIVAAQFALFEVFGDTAVYYPSMIIAAFIIYILVIICALYPARLASKIQPAEALHEE